MRSEELESPAANRLLAALAPATRAEVTAHLEPVDLHTGAELFREDGPVPHVYFPTSAVVSIVSLMDDGRTVEVGTIGRDGLAGLPAILGVDRSPYRGFCQIAGRSFRIATATARELAARGGPFLDVVHRYTTAFLTQVTQTAACNRLHTADARLARWLLMTRDRVGSDRLPLTHEFLGHMLGVRRAGVTEAAGRLADEGVIRWTRGTVQILDPVGLERASCECYGVVRRRQEEALP